MRDRKRDKRNSPTFSTSRGVCGSGELQQAFALHGVDVGSGGVPGSGFDFVVELELQLFVVLHVFDGREDGLVSVAGVFEALLRRQHRVVGASRFRRHQRPNLFLMRQPEVVLQHPPERQT